MRVFLTAALLAAAALCSACGATQRDDDATAVVQRFQAALDAGDGAPACAELSEDTSQALEDQQGRPCEEAILSIELPTGEQVGYTSVEVTSAAVSLVEGGTLFLSEAAGRWEIAAAGCSPTAPELPYECELED